MKRLSALRASFLRIHLVDRCLMLFMIVLLLQSAYSIFALGDADGGNKDIDIIVRTSSAAIFGYFLSADLRRKTAGGTASATTSSAAAVQLTAPGVSDESPSARIGFSVFNGETDSSAADAGTLAGSSVKTANDTADGTASCDRLKILVTTGIGLFCLIVLLVLRNLPQWNEVISGSAALSAAASQFRDFVSGCVGFLIGCPNHNSDTAS